MCLFEFRKRYICCQNGREILGSLGSGRQIGIRLWGDFSRDSHRVSDGSRYIGVALGHNVLVRSFASGSVRIVACV